MQTRWDVEAPSKLIWHQFRRIVEGRDTAHINH